MGNYFGVDTGLARFYTGKLIAYIKPASGTSFQWISQADVVAGASASMRGFMANTTYHTSGSGITALLQPFGGVNSTAAGSDSPPFAYQVNVSSYSTTSILKWNLCCFSTRGVNG
jgi:hypothetical protein